jgi:hypothetical protein
MTTDVIDYALMRHGELAEAITRREAEIARIQKEKERLENFVCMAKELTERAASGAGKDRRKADPEAEASEDVPEIEPRRVMPIRQAASA